MMMIVVVVVVVVLIVLFWAGAVLVWFLPGFLLGSLPPPFPLFTIISICAVGGGHNTIDFVGYIFVCFLRSLF